MTQRLCQTSKLVSEKALSKIWISKVGNKIFDFKGKEWTTGKRAENYQRDSGKVLNRYFILDIRMPASIIDYDS